MSTDEIDTDPRVLARAALRELDAETPDESPAELMGGPLSWGESAVTMAEAERDPDNAPTMRPHVVAPCQKLQKHRALRLHCYCGKGLDYLALASLSTGVLVVSSPRLLPPKQRGGGPQDLGPLDGQHPESGWALIPWERSMRQREGAHVTAWRPESSHPVLGDGAFVLGDTAKRQTFICPKCGATHTFKNIRLLRLVLDAIVNGQPTVRLVKSTESAAPT